MPDTGRLASRDPNLQNIPQPKDHPEARASFIARPGHVFVEGDYSNLEPRILAYISNDIASIKIFEAGKNIHDENTKAYFPWLTPDHPLWKDGRMGAKKGRLAMNYGGSVRSVYRKVCLEVPKLKLSFNQFNEACQRYDELHVQEVAWREKIKKEVLQTKQLRNVFGRIRIFLGTESEIQREGVNFPIQSTAADLINYAIIRIWNELKKWPTLPLPQLLLQVHDSLLVECKKSDAKKVIALMNREMEKPVKIGKRTVIFPVEFSTGKDWGHMVKL